MGLIKKYKNGDKTEKPKNLLTYLNVGTYDADLVATEFTKGLEKFADSNHLTGQMRQYFLQKGDAMAQAIKDGNVTKLANGQYSITGDQANVLNNIYSQSDIDKLKEEGKVGRGAQAYTGNYQKSHGVFTTKETEEFREKNHASGLVGTYLNKILGTMTTTEEQEKAKPKETSSYNFDSSFITNILGGQAGLKNSWMALNKKDDRIKALTTALGHADFDKWAESYDNYDAAQLRNEVGTIINDLNNGNIKAAQNKAFALGFSIDDYIKDDPKIEVKKTDDELFEEAYLKQNPSLASQWHLISDEDKKALLNAAKIKQLGPLQDLYNQLHDLEVQRAWDDVVTNVPGAIFDELIDEESKYNLTYHSGETDPTKRAYDFSNVESFNNSLNKLTNANNTIKRNAVTQLNTLFNLFAGSNNKIHQIMEAIDKKEKGYDELIPEASYLINAYSYLNNYINNLPSILSIAKKAGVTGPSNIKLETFFIPITEGPYKGWTYMPASNTDKGDKILIFNNNPWSSDAGSIKIVNKNLLSKEVFTNDYTKQHPKKQVIFNKQGGIVKMLLGGFTPIELIPTNLTIVKTSDSGNSDDTDMGSLFLDTEGTHTAGQNPVIMKNGEFLPEDEQLSNADISRLVGLGGDLVSLFGGIPGAVGGVTSIGAHGYADIQDWLDGNQTGWDATSSILQNTGLSLIGLIPGAASLKALKGTKYVNTASSLLKYGLRSLAVLGVITDAIHGLYAKSIDNFKNGNITVLDAKTLVNLISTILSVTPGGTLRQRLRSGKYNSFDMTGNVEVKAANGKNITMTHQQFKELASAEKSQRNQVFLNIQRDNWKKSNPNGDVSKIEVADLPKGWKSWGEKGWQGPNKINVTSDNRTLTTRKYVDAEGVVREVKPNGLMQFYVNGRGAPFYANWGTNIRLGINKVTPHRGNIVELPEAKRLGKSNAYEFNGKHYVKLDGYFKRISAEEALTLQQLASRNAPKGQSTRRKPKEKPTNNAEEKPNTPPNATNPGSFVIDNKTVLTAASSSSEAQKFIDQIKAREKKGQSVTKTEQDLIKKYFDNDGTARHIKELLRQLNLLKQGGPLDFASDIIRKYQTGGKNGIKHKGHWYSTGGKLALDEVLKRLTSGEEKYKDYYKKLNDYQKRHYKLYTASGFANNPENTYYKHADVSSYLNDYNNEGYNSIAIWPFFKLAYTVNSTNPLALDREGTNGVDGIYSGITDNRRILGREGDFDEATLKEYTDKFKQAGYNYYLDKDTGYYMLDLINNDSDDSEAGEKQGDGTETSGNTEEKTKDGTGNLAAAEDTENEQEDANLVNWKRAPNYSNIGELLRVGYLNGINAYATKIISKYQLPLLDYLHRHEILEGDYLAKVASEKQNALLLSIAAKPQTSNANQYTNSLLDATSRGNQLSLQAAVLDSNKQYDSRHKVQDLINQDLVENINRHDRNVATWAEKARLNANMKANRVIENARNFGNLWAGFNQQWNENNSRRQQTYVNLIQSLFGNKLAAEANSYATQLALPNADYDALTSKYISTTNALYDQLYNAMIDLLQNVPFWAKVPYRRSIGKSRKGSKLTASQEMMLESNKDFNKAMRENRKEFYKNIRANNKRKRR